MNADIDITRLERLKENWDSYGGKPITKAALNKAENILNSITVSPLPDGGLAIDYEVSGICLTIEIKPDGSIM
jgi:hypothetical protein